MKIKFKTAGIMSDILPADALDDEMMLTMPEGATTIDVMAHFNLPVDDFYLVILNDVVVPKAKRAAIVLSNGDELGIFPPLKGG